MAALYIFTKLHQVVIRQSETLFKLPMLTSDGLFEFCRVVELFGIFFTGFQVYVFIYQQFNSPKHKIDHHKCSDWFQDFCVLGDFPSSKMYVPLRCIQLSLPHFTAHVYLSGKFKALVYIHSCHSRFIGKLLKYTANVQLKSPLYQSFIP